MISLHRKKPAAGIGVFGVYGLAPMSIIETDEGRFAFGARDTVHDGELTLAASRTVTRKPAKAIIYGHSDTVMGTGVIAGGNKDVMTIGHPAFNDVVASNPGGQQSGRGECTVTVKITLTAGAPA